MANQLQSGADYAMALLWMMTKLVFASKYQVRVEFERRFGRFIDAEMRQEDNYGRIHWHNRLDNANSALIKVGLMEKGRRGTWTISAAGQQWVRDHPEGGQAVYDELQRQARQAPDTMKNEPAQSRAAPPERRKRRRSRSAPAADPDRAAHKRLDEWIAELRTFLRGNAAHRPPDETLCDWVYLCYTFGLYQEGNEIFQVIHEDSVDSVLYKRARRYVRIFRLSENGQG